jgi:outer membrane protein TolC
MLACLLAATLTFPAALDQAIHARGAADYYEQQAKTLESFSLRNTPSVRAETGLMNNVLRIDAFTALVTVDYPLLQHQPSLRADAALLRLRADEEANEIFRQTLDAFASLYLADARLELLRTTLEGVGSLRERSQAMLANGMISNTTAAQWEDQALTAESALVDLRLQRLDAETRLKRLIGDPSNEPLRIASLDDIAPRTMLSRPKLQEERAQIALQDAIALRKPQILMSAFGGVANVTEGTFGLYGLRFTFTLPMFDGALARRVTMTRIEADDAARARTLAETAQRNRAALFRQAMTAQDQRIALLTQAVDVAKQREQSVTRLVNAGVRRENDLLDAASDIARRESDLVAVRVERWKLEQQLRWEP